MAWFGADVKDWSERRRHSKGNFVDKTLQQGTVSFGRKKKNGCRLVSTGTIKRVEQATADRVFHGSCKMAFKKIPIR